MPTQLFSMHNIHCLINDWSMLVRRKAWLRVEFYCHVFERERFYPSLEGYSYSWICFDFNPNDSSAARIRLSISYSPSAVEMSVYHSTTMHRSEIERIKEDC